MENKVTLVVSIDSGGNQQLRNRAIACWVEIFALDLGIDRMGVDFEDDGIVVTFSIAPGFEKK